MQVFDLETTGADFRSPTQGGDRHYVAEVAIVTLAESGAVTDRWSTVVRVPLHDADGGLTDLHTRIHGITWGDTLAAPTWREVAGEVADRLTGEVVIGHNVDRFDLPFLRAALARAGHTLTVARTVDTLTRDRALRPVGSHTLTAACKAWGLTLTGAHRALADTLATADLATRQAALIGWGGR